MTKHFVIAGASGSGKTAIRKELAAAGFATVSEPAREVIPDRISYAGLFGIDGTDASVAAVGRRYEDTVFALPSWSEIDTTDEDRKMPLEHARVFGDRVRDIYADLGYTLVDVPKRDVVSRAGFIIGVVEGAA